MCREEPPPPTTMGVPLPPPILCWVSRFSFCVFKVVLATMRGLCLEEFFLFEGKLRFSPDHVNVGTEIMRKVLLHGDLQWDNRSPFPRWTLMEWLCFGPARSAIRGCWHLVGEWGGCEWAAAATPEGQRAPGSSGNRMRTGWDTAPAAGWEGAKLPAPTALRGEENPSTHPCLCKDLGLL